MVASDTFCSIANINLKLASYNLDNENYSESVGKSTESIIACLKQVLVISDFDDYVRLKTMSYDDLKYYVSRSKVRDLDSVCLETLDGVMSLTFAQVVSKRDAKESYSVARELYNFVNNL